MQKWRSPFRFPCWFCFSSRNTFLERKSFQWLMDVASQGAGLLGGRDGYGSGWGLQLASSIQGPLCTALIFHFWEIPFNFISLPRLLQGKWRVLHVLAQSLCLYPPASCVCARVQAQARVLTPPHSSLCLAVALLQVKQQSHIFLACSNLVDLSWNFGLKLRFH